MGSALIHVVVQCPLTFSLGAVHTSRYFWPIFTPPPVTFLHTSRDPPESTSHILDLSPLPRFLEGLVQKPGQKPLVQILSQLFAGVFVRGSFVWKVLSGWFLSVPVLLEYICYIRKLYITLNFMFRMYD